MNLDPIAGGLWAVAALAVFYLHSTSSPERRSWINLPFYVRLGFVLAGVTFTLRAVDLFSIADKNIPRGHVNMFGVMSALAIAYLALVSVICIYQHRLRNSQWQGVREVVHTLHGDATSVPVAIPRWRVITVLRALGVKAAGPNDPPSSLNTPDG